jgi:ribonuclease HI
MAEVKVMVQVKGIQLFLYLDDWLAQVTSYLSGLAQSSYLTSLCQELGLLINFQKSELCPSQDFEFIGARFNLLLERVFPKKENLERLQNKIQKFLSSTSATARDFQSLLGSMASQFRFIRYAQLFMRPLQWYLSSQWDQLWGHPSEILPISPQIKACCQWWLNQTKDPKGVPLHPPAFLVHIYTDASGQGWGAHVADAADTKYQGLWSQEESQMNINVLEMRAVRMGLLRYNPAPHSSILISTDNSTVKAYINRQGGTRSWQLMEETVKLYHLVIQNNWYIRAKHIPGRLNVIADHLSRAGQILPTEWSLHPEAAELIFQKWGRPMIDLFATKTNKKCLMYVSPVPDKEAMAIDALSMSFQGLVAYAYPPTQILAKTLQKFQQTTECSLIVVAPWWPKQSWFPTLCQLAVGKPLKLPHWEKLLKQPGSNIYHQNPQILDLHAWMLRRQL